MSPASGPDLRTLPYAAATALLARQVLGCDVPRGELAGGIPADDVLRAMEVITAAVLAGGWPDDRGADVLRQVGEYFATAGAAP